LSLYPFGTWTFGFVSTLVQSVADDRFARLEAKGLHVAIKPLNAVDDLVKVIAAAKCHRDNDST
jgi:hypothetical protein